MVAIVKRQPEGWYLDAVLVNALNQAMRGQGCYAGGNLTPALADGFYQQPWIVRNSKMQLKKSLGSSAGGYLATRDGTNPRYCAWGALDADQDLVRVDGSASASPALTHLANVNDLIFWELYEPPYNNNEAQGGIVQEDFRITSNPDLRALTFGFALIGINDEYWYDVVTSGSGIIVSLAGHAKLYTTTSSGYAALRTAYGSNKAGQWQVGSQPIMYLRIKAKGSNAWSAGFGMSYPALTELWHHCGIICEDGYLKLSNRNSSGQTDVSAGTADTDWHLFEIYTLPQDYPGTGWKSVLYIDGIYACENASNFPTVQGPLGAKAWMANSIASTLELDELTIMTEAPA